MSNPRRGNYTGNPIVDKNIQDIYNLINTLIPVNTKAKNANLIQTSKGIDTSQNISEESTSFNVQALGAGVKPVSGQVFTIKDKQNIGTRTFDTTWRTGTGWGVTYENGEYNAYFDNVQINGNLRAREFIIEQTKIRDANYLFTNAGKVARTNGSTWFDVEDPSENGTAPFEVNDIIECLQVSLTGATYSSNEFVDDGYLIKRLVYRVTAVSGLRVTVTTATGAPTNKGTIKRGDVFARVANTSVTSRQGLVGIFNDEEYAPYFDVRAGLSSYAAYKSNSNLKVRIGRLDGITDANFPDLNGAQSQLYGAYLVGNIYLKGDIVMDNQSSINISGFNNDAGYTDDTVANSKIKTFYQSTAPSTSEPEGSIWFDSDDLNAMYRLESSVWVEKVGAGTGLGTYIDATGVYTGQLSAAQINAINIDAVNITGGSISGTTITGGTVQTASSGSRIKMVGATNTIDFYWDNTNYYSLYAAAGELYLGGAFKATSYITSNDYINANSGFRAGGTVPSAGNYLRSNGSYFVNATIQAGDLPTGIDATKLADGTVTNTELQYINSVTSNVQTQLNNKVGTSDVLTISQGGTGRSSHTGGRVIVSNVGGTELGVSTTTSTEVQLLNGKTGLLNFRGELASAPSSPASGHCYLNTTTSPNKFYIYSKDDTAWIALN